MCRVYSQLRLEDVLFYMDAVTHAKQRASHDDEQTQPVCQAESQSEQDDEEAGIGNSRVVQHAGKPQASTHCASILRALSWPGQDFWR